MMSLTTTLTLEHRQCDELYTTLENTLRNSDWLQAERLFARFSGSLLQHFVDEEQLLFPAFEAVTGNRSGPTQVMRFEHQQIRDELDALQHGIQQRDRSAAIGHADTLLILIQQHNVKEENILYPMCEQRIPDIAQRWQERHHVAA
ncbi:MULTISPECIES: hemerythrin domain-containing protein [Leeia]|uniref:Hemerythrin domain-containing protein n=1 Tax=Leeia aquatica TaxID=2725557 RepID=A0A847S854_9NEIS|nr:hemerythrin domain-containing protein [Leeia aquatica]NLR75187.1 hemerythrin domain-containing protein [Leeia aquatica]